MSIFWFKIHQLNKIEFIWLNLPWNSAQFLKWLSDKIINSFKFGWNSFLFVFLGLLTFVKENRIWVRKKSFCSLHPQLFCPLCVPSQLRVRDLCGLWVSLVELLMFLCDTIAVWFLHPLQLPFVGASSVLSAEISLLIACLGSHEEDTLSDQYRMTVKQEARYSFHDLNCVC